MFFYIYTCKYYQSNTKLVNFNFTTFDCKWAILLNLFSISKTKKFNYFITIIIESLWSNPYFIVATNGTNANSCIDRSKKAAIFFVCNKRKILFRCRAKRFIFNNKLHRNKLTKSSAKLLNETLLENIKLFLTNHETNF